MTAAPASAEALRGRWAPGLAAPVAVLAVAAATGAAVALWGDPLVAAVPVALAAAGFALARAPLRAPAAILAFLVLAVDDTGNARGLWYSPLAGLGDVLRRSLRTYFPASGLPVTGIEIALAALLLVAAWRAGRGARDPAHVSSPRPVIAVGLAYLAAIGLAVAVGLARGGSAEMAVWQTRPLLTAAAFYALFEAALRGPVDHAALGRLVVAAAVVRALLAAWVRWVALPGSGVEYATDHGDSMLFSIACVILVAHLLEGRGRRRVAPALALLAVLLVGIAANWRRTAWLQLFVSFPVLLVIGRHAPWKRPLGRGLALALPLLLLYGAAGWGSTRAVYGPVEMIRSVVDPRVDRSTWAREVENWNLAMSARANPVLGRGFGHEWTEFFRGDELTSIFFRYKAEPHNQVLGLLLYAGPIAFAAIWAPFALLVFLAARAYPRARTGADRAAALAVAATAVIIGVQCFSDLGPFWHQYWVLGGLALAAGGKLAAATGALR